jgi:hypothetical protein
MLKINNKFLYIIFFIYIFLFLIAARFFLSGFLFNSSGTFNVFSIAYYGLFVLLLFLFISLNFKSGEWKNKPSFILFAIVFAYSLFWIKQGLDLTDEGFTISKSYFMLNGLWKENVDFIGGTTLLNGLWLMLAGSPFILWERIGYSLIIAFIALLSYKILSFYFNDILSALSVFASITFVRMNIQSVNYNVVPGFLVLVSVFLLFKALRENELSLKRKSVFIFISGFIIGYSIFARFTYLSYMFLIFLFFGLYFLFIKEKKAISYYLINLAGILTGIIFWLVILKFTNSLNAYINNIKYMFFDVLVTGKNLAGHAVSTETHSFAALIGDYIKNFKEIIFYYIVFMIVPFSAVSLKKRIKSDNINQLLNWIIYLSIISVYIFLFRKYFDKRIFLSVMLMNLTFILFSKVDLKKYFFIIFWALALPLFNALGSDVFFDNFFTSGGIIFLLSISFIGIYKAEIKIKKEIISLKKLALFLICFVVLSGGWRQMKFVYRDILIFDKANTLFESRNLAGIRTSSERKEAIEGLEKYFNGIKDFKNRKILIINSQPMLYSILEHKYFFQTPWAPWTFLEDASYLAFKLEEHTKNGDFPDYIIFPMKDSRQDLWPMTEKKCRASDLESYELFKKFISENSYDLVFTNIGYEVYKRKSNLGK